MNASIPTPYILNSPKRVSQLLTLAHQAKLQVPFYQQHFSHLDFTAPSLQLTDIPLLHKEDVRSAQDRLVKSTYRRDQPGEVIDYTSGSTGIPLRLVHTQAEVMRCARSLWKARAEHFPAIMEATGVMLFPIMPQNATRPKANISKKGNVFLTTLDWNIQHVDSYLDLLDSLKPQWLNGPPAMLAIVAERLQRTRRRLRTSLVFIESFGDWLSPALRNLLAEAFQCRIVNHYGGQEVHTIAYECPRGNMHIIDECVVAELHPHQTEQYELVVSSLVFETMPIIRYKLGDFIEPGEPSCLCSKSTPVLGDIQGRVSEIIAGTTLPGNHVFYQVINLIAKAEGPLIQQYRVNQTSLHHFEVQLVLSDRGQLPTISSQFKEFAMIWLPQASFSFSFELVDHIEPTQEGKIRHFVPYV